MSCEQQKVRVLVVSDWADTGFGRVMKELLPRLVRTGLYQIEMVAWCYDGDDPDVYDQAKALGVRLHPGYDWGRPVLGSVVKRFRPHVLLSLGDPWMTEYIAQQKWRAHVPWVAYVPIDRDPISDQWKRMLRSPDCLVLYSRFGMEVVRRQMPFRNPVLIYHGVDAATFRRFSPEEKRAAKNFLKLSPDAFCVGMVCRNQERKNVPAGIAAFKAFNCACCEDHSLRSSPPVGVRERYSCPACGNFRQDPEKAAAKLYLHMTMGDGSDVNDGWGATWNIRELATRYGLGSGQIKATQGLDVRRGVSSEELSIIYNGFDVHLLTTKREGFGLPILEAMACGVPNVVTGYSSCVELVEQGGGALIDVLAWDCDVHHEAEGAIVDPVSAADELHRFFRNEGLREEVAASSRAFAESVTWDSTVPSWIEVLHGVAGREVPQYRRPQPEDVTEWAGELALIEN